MECVFTYTTYATSMYKYIYFEDYKCSIAKITKSIEIICTYIQQLLLCALYNIEELTIYYVYML